MLRKSHWLQSPVSSLEAQSIGYFDRARIEFQLGDFKLDFNTFENKGDPNFIVVNLLIFTMLSDIPHGKYF